MNKGVPAENALGFQIVVVPEEPDEDLALMLKSIVEGSGVTDEQKMDILRKDKSGKLKESFWLDLAFKQAINRINKGDVDMGLSGVLELMEKKGFLMEHDQKVVAQGVEKVLALLNVDPNKAAEVKRQLQLQPA